MGIDELDKVTTYSEQIQLLCELGNRYCLQSVTEYSKSHKISRQAVYAQIKRRTVAHVWINGKLFLIKS